MYAYSPIGKEAESLHYPLTLVVCSSNGRRLARHAGNMKCGIGVGFVSNSRVALYATTEISRNVSGLVGVEIEVEVGAVNLCVGSLVRVDYAFCNPCMWLHDV